MGNTRGLVVGVSVGVAFAVAGCPPPPSLLSFPPAKETEILGNERLNAMFNGTTVTLSTRFRGRAIEQ